MHILVFKTNLRFKKDLKKIEPLLDRHPCVIRWNVDRNDADKVLRIEATDEQASEFIHTIQHAGYYCEELPG